MGGTKSPWLGFPAVRATGHGSSPNRNRLRSLADAMNARTVEKIIAQIMRQLFLFAAGHRDNDMFGFFFLEPCQDFIILRRRPSDAGNKRRFLINPNSAVRQPSRRGVRIDQKSSFVAGIAR